MGAIQGDNSLFFSTGIDNSGLKSGVNQSVGLIQGLASKVGSINPFAALAIGATIAFATIANQSYKMAKDFNKAMLEVKTISDAAQKDFKSISSKVFEISKDSVDTPKQLAEAYYQIVSASFDGAEGIKLLDTSTKAAVAGVTDTKTAADGLTTVLNAFNISANESERVADIFFNTVKLGKTTFSELANSISLVAPIAAASNIPFEQIASAVASLTKSGVPTSQAMTQIRASIIALNDNLSDGWAKTMTYQDGLQLLFDKAHGSQKELKNLIGRVEGVSAVLTIAGKNINRSNKDLESYKNIIGATSKAAKTMLDENGNQWRLFKNNVSNATRGIGEDILKMSTGLAKSLNLIFDKPKGIDVLKQALDDERTNIFLLKLELNKLNEKGTDRNDFIKKIIKLYPNYLKGIDAEKISNGELLTILDKVNDSYKIRYKFASRQKELNDAIAKQGNIEIKIEDLTDTFNQELARIVQIAKDRSIEINIDPKLSPQNLFYSVSQQIKDAERKAGNATSSGLILNTELIQAVGTSLQGYGDKIASLNKELIDQNKIVEDITEKNNRLTKQDLKNAESRKQAIEKINKALTKNEISNFSNTGFKDIEKAYRDRIKVIEKLNSINNITKSDLKENPSIFSDFLKSDNTEIKKAAEERKKLLEFTPAGDPTKFKDALKLKEEQFKNYNLALKNNDLDLAKKLKETYRLKEDDYIAYLQKLYKATNDFNSKTIILNELDNLKSGTTNRSKVRALPTIETKPISLKFKVDTTSINFIKQQLNNLVKDYEAAQTDAERTLIANKIKAEKKKLEAAQSHINGEKDLYGDLNRTIERLSSKELRILIANKRKELEQKLKDEIKYAKEIAKLKGEILDAQKELGNNMSETISDIQAVFSEASSLFSKFSNEDMAQLMDQLSEVAQGVGTLALGIASENPLEIIAGSLQILNAALTVEIESNTAKFVKQIEEMSRVLTKLYKDIADAIGYDKINLRVDALKKEADLLEANKKALQAEIEARKTTKLLGITIAKKGKGSGTDEQKIKDFEDAIDEANRKLKELQTEIYQTLTAATSESITDSIIQGFKDGKKGAQDFAGTFEDLMKKAILESFKLKYLEKATNAFFEQFGALAESDQGLTPEEIATLRASFADLITNSQAELDALNQILGDAGISGGLFGSSQTSKGLSGSIRASLTEETGTELAGLMRRIAYDMRKGLENGVRALEHLAEINKNTFKTVIRLDSAITELKQINTNTTPSQGTRDLGGD